MLFRFLTVLFFVVVCGFLVALGFWQLDRADQKQQRFDAYQRASNTNLLDLEGIRKNHLTSDDLLWRRVILSGYYLDDHVLLDNQTVKGSSFIEIQDFTNLLLDYVFDKLADRGLMDFDGDFTTLHYIIKSDARKSTFQNKMLKVKINEI